MSISVGFPCFKFADIVAVIIRIKIEYRCESQVNQFLSFRLMNIFKPVGTVGADLILSWSTRITPLNFYSGHKRDDIT